MKNIKDSIAHKIITCKPKNLWFLLSMAKLSRDCHMLSVNNKKPFLKAAVRYKHNRKHIENHFRKYGTLDGLKHIDIRFVKPF